MANGALQRGAKGYIVVYALAWAGGAIAYTPLLTILLPVRVAALAGPSAGVDWLARIAIVGAIAASCGGILFGHLSDITGNRRGWIALGMVLSCLLLQLVGQATSLGALLLTITAWQLALNMMLAPLAALAADRVPDTHKGLLGGLMAFSPAFGALAGAIVTLPDFVGSGARLWLVAGLVAVCLAPILTFAPGASLLPPTPDGPDPQASQPSRDRLVTGQMARMWLARVAVQVAEACLFSYLYFWLVSLDPAITENAVARLFSITMFAAAPLALAAGGWSDRSGRPITPLRICGVMAACGLAVMTVAKTVPTAAAGYGVFGLASAVFLALHSAQTLRVLPRPQSRARDLGIFNLTNTAPSLVMPWLAAGIIPRVGFQGLFAVLAALSLFATFLLAPVARLAGPRA